MGECHDLHNSRATLDLAAATGWHWPAGTAAGAWKWYAPHQPLLEHDVSWCFPIFSAWNIVSSPSFPHLFPMKYRLIMFHPHHFSIISPSVHHRKPQDFPIVSPWCSSPPSYRRRLCIRLLGRQVLCAAQFEVEPTAVGPRGGPIASEALEAWAPREPSSRKIRDENSDRSETWLMYHWCGIDISNQASDFSHILHNRYIQGTPQLLLRPGEGVPAAEVEIQETWTVDPWERGFNTQTCGLNQQKFGFNLI